LQDALTGSKGETDYSSAFGAAILTERVQRGLADTKERGVESDKSELAGIEKLSKEERRKAKVRAVTGVVVWDPPSSIYTRGAKGEPSELARLVTTPTRASLDAAHLAFAEAMGQLHEAPKAKRQRAKVKAKPLAIERVRPFGVGEW
jgi:hypothetical protein